MTSSPKPINPFYRALLVVGTVFAVTACAYGVLIVLKQDPRRTIDSPLAIFLDQRGMLVLTVELALLGVLTFAAIGTDDYWERRAARTADDSAAPPPSEREQGEP